MSNDRANGKVTHETCIVHRQTYAYYRPSHQNSPYFPAVASALSEEAFFGCGRRRYYLCWGGSERSYLVLWKLLCMKRDQPLP